VFGCDYQFLERDQLADTTAIYLERDLTGQQIIFLPRLCSA